MHPKNLSISDFTYELPQERIAKYPLEERDNSKLLVYKSGKITTSCYKYIDQFLPADTLLVFNNTKVIEARLLFQKPTGGVIEIFCLEPADQYADITTAMLQKEKVFWKCLVGGAGKWKHGTRLEKRVQVAGNEVILEAVIVERLFDSFVIELSWQPKSYSFAEVLHHSGFIPLPPYLQRNVEESDKDRYQTIYAANEGSVAAPTAGLHFTDLIFKKLAKKNIQKEFVTLHVGAGTFKPVKAVKMHEHTMHAEFIDVTMEAIQNLLNNLDKTIVAVGTTSLRTIESLYWLGVRITRGLINTTEQMSVLQWEPYETAEPFIPAKAALSNLLEWMEKKALQRIIAKTHILIAPGYDLKIAKGIITNFHQPQSTLLLLVSAIVGQEWRNIYQYAINNDFRFLSYGDGCLLWKDDK